MIISENLDFGGVCINRHDDDMFTLSMQSQYFTFG